MVRYLVRCARCDQAFWQDSRDVPVPEHSRWERRVAAHRDTGSRCDGSMRRGYWIAEGEDSSPVGLLTRAGRPAAALRPPARPEVSGDSARQDW
jgi:hypothetical protein